jgi:hypothetical protein
MHQWQKGKGKWGCWCFLEPKKGQNCVGEFIVMAMWPHEGDLGLNVVATQNGGYVGRLIY